MCCGGHVFPFCFVFFGKKFLFLLFFNRDREKCVVEGMCFLFALFFCVDPGPPPLPMRACTSLSKNT